MDDFLLGRTELVDREFLEEEGIVNMGMKIHSTGCLGSTHES